MTTSNPYQAPSSDVSQAGSSEVYNPKIFSTKGRIGRMRYLAYSFIAYLIILPFAAIVGVIGAVTDASGEPPLAVLALFGIGYIAMIVFFFIVAKRRFNDMNLSGWFSALMIIPLVNIFIGLWLMFGRGSLESNKFGPVPTKNPVWVWIVGLLMPIAFIGIIAAVAIPAYQDYEERARQYESQLSE